MAVLTTFIQQVIYGISYGMNLAVAAAGLALLFGVYRVVNLAHGQQIMLGGYTAYVVSTSLGTPYLVGFVAAMIAMGLLGVLLEYGVFRFLRDRPLTDQMLASLGVFMLLGTLALRVWGDFQARTIYMPGRDSAILIGGLRLDASRIYTVLITIVLFALLYLVVYRTHLGRMMRAMAQSEETAALMGIQRRRIAAIVFFLAGALGGAAGALLGGLFNVRPDMGFQPLLMALVIIVFGGMGSIGGAVFAGLVIGILYNLSVFYVAPTLGDLVPFLVLLAVLMLRPEGIFGLPQRRA
ncbi:branched-chain amino acid ABC transporter permease [Bradyrhizobium sp.]|uniref:branched-chain amino acid ABC transporter permease n=1 Tax=Bradyrhizobium sp. TaxID=376 RepID=UPI002B560B0D|nr:branched-chain amino acid ABC transporter permease [Bradyrhizobium sp.]HWX60298.1 branched-chain amino acid ABC transporter permease [Bradyrhizobium sp.]